MHKLTNEQINGQIFHKVSSTHAQSNLTYDRIAAADSWIVFARWRQCALPCGRIGTTWQMFPSAHTCLQPKRQIDQFSRFCTAHGRKSLYCTTGDSFPQNCPFSWGGDLDPYLTHDSLSQTKPTVQTASRLVQLFLHRWLQGVLILYNGCPFPPQNCPFPWGIWTPSNTWFPGPTQVLNPNGIPIGSAVFAGLISVTDRQTTLLGQ